MDFFNYLQKKKSETTVVYYILTYSKYVSKITILIFHVLISDHLVPATLCEMLLLGFLRTSCLSDIVNHKITQAELYSLMYHAQCLGINPRQQTTAKAGHTHLKV